MTSPKRQTRSTAGPAPSSEIARLLENMKKEIISKFETEISSLKTSLDNLSSRMASLEGRISSLQNKTEEHDNDIKVINESMINIKQNLSSNVIEEVMQRVQRQHSLIVTGLPEPSSGSVEERDASDRRAVAEVIGAIGVRHDVNSFRLTRIGKTHSTRSRLLKVECESGSTKIEILQKAKLLRKSMNFKNVFINEDRTPQQQQEWREVRQKLKHRKDLGEDVVIYRNKVMLRKEVQGFQKQF